MVENKELKLIGSKKSPGLLDLVKDQQLVVPEFQRPYIWDSKPLKTCGLLASIARHWPAGALLLMEGSRGFGTQDVHKWAANEAEESPHAGEPRYAILDGQQRITALYHAFFGLDEKYSFFVDIKGLIDHGDVLAHEHRHQGTFQAWTDSEIKKQGLQSQGDQAKEGLILVHELISSKSRESWVDASDYGFGDVDVLREGDGPLAGLASYSFPVSIVLESAPIEALATIFVEINRQGTPLNTFDLVTARTIKRKGGAGAGKAFNLRAAWLKRSADQAVTEAKGEIPKPTYPTLSAFVSKATPRKRHGETPLKALLLESGKSSLSNNDMVSMEPEYVRAHFSDAAKAFNDTLKFLSVQIGLIPDTLPDDNYLLPIVAIALEKPSVLLGKGPVNKMRSERLVRWYWAATLSAAFSTGSTQGLVVEAYSSLRNWVMEENEPAPRALVDFWAFWDREAAARLLEPRPAGKEHFLKAVLQLEVNAGARDWIGFKATPDAKPEKFPLKDSLRVWPSAPLEVHHMWPQGGKAPAGSGKVKGIAIPSGQNAIHSAINRCLLLKSTNSVISQTPFTGVRTIEDVKSSELATYCLDADAKGWSSFVKARFESLSVEVERVLPRKELEQLEGPSESDDPQSDIIENEDDLQIEDD